MLGFIIDTNPQHAYELKSLLCNAFRSSEFRDYCYAVHALNDAIINPPHLVIVRDHVVDSWNPMRAFELRHEWTRRGLPAAFFVAIRTKTYDTNAKVPQAVYREFGFDAWRYGPIDYTDLLTWAVEGERIENRRKREATK